mgnify:CR=1 FL=1
MINVSEWSHGFFLEQDFRTKTLVDMTAGTGRDTLFLASISARVIAFDIQSEAIEITQKLLEENKIDNVELIHDDHQNLGRYITSKIAGAIYNLGYLPGGEKTIRTGPGSTISSLRTLLGLLEPGGIVVMVVYQKHDQTESMRLLHFCEELPGRIYDVTRYSVLNKELAPYIIKIQKQDK